MSKKLISILLAATLVTAMFTGCAKKPETTAPTLKVGMVTDAGTIDDKSFNQGTWEGIEKAATEFGLEYKYLKPTGTTEADYLKEIANLYDAGFRLIVTPGFKFSSAIAKAQEKYTDCKFVLIDAEPDGGVTAANTVSVYFAEHQSGFAAGLAAALKVGTGDVGFIGGMEIPAVQKFNWGFQQGVKYANENLGTTISMKPENFIYQGTFSDVAAGQQLAASMYDKGVKCIFIAAGGVGVGAIGEAKARKAEAPDIWAIGVDVDQYADGIYNDKDSVVLTSAMKKIDVVSYEMVKAELDGTFPGGQVLTYDASNAGVGLPATNPNLSDEIVGKVDEVFAKVVSGDIVVDDKQGELIK